MTKICGIYKITSPSGKVYIGQSVNILSRKKRYKYGDSKCQPRIHRSILKYGFENHLFEIIHECNQSELNELEIFYIKKFNCFDTLHGLNLNSGGKKNIVSEETKAKQRLAQIGNKNAAGTVRSLADKQLLREINLGKKHSIETRRKMSEAHKGKKMSQQFKLKMSKIHKGKKISDEHKNRLRLANKGKKLSEEAKKHLRNIHKGKKFGYKYG